MCYFIRILWLETWYTFGRRYEYNMGIALLARVVRPFMANYPAFFATIVFHHISGIIYEG